MQIEKARINVKLVSQAGVGNSPAGWSGKAMAECYLILRADGGTVLSPPRLSSIRHAGLPWEL